MKLLDVVALSQNLPEKHLSRGQVGTIVKVLEAGVYEVEFRELDGETYALAAAEEKNMIQLIHQAIAA